VDATGATEGQALLYTEGQWQPGTVSSSAHYTRIAADGSIRMAADSSLRISD
jgi:hypothetical protein